MTLDRYLKNYFYGEPHHLAIMLDNLYMTYREFDAAGIVHGKLLMKEPKNEQSIADVFQLVRDTHEQFMRDKAEIMAILPDLNSIVENAGGYELEQLESLEWHIDAAYRTLRVMYKPKGDSATFRTMSLEEVKIKSPSFG